MAVSRQFLCNKLPPLFKAPVTLQNVAYTHCLNFAGLETRSGVRQGNVRLTSPRQFLSSYLGDILCISLRESQMSLESLFSLMRLPLEGKCGRGPGAEQAHLEWLLVSQLFPRSQEGGHGVHIWIMCFGMNS